MISEDGLALNLPSEIQDITGKFSSKRPLFIKRDDQIHAWISGNKWRKLQGHLDHALNQDYSVYLLPSKNSFCRGHPRQGYLKSHPKTA